DPRGASGRPGELLLPRLPAVGSQGSGAGPCFGALYATLPTVSAGGGSASMQSRDLAARFEAYSDWRRRLSARISELHDWLSQQELADAQADIAIQQLLERLHQDKLVVAFVAEFSRGKSELINAVFFADFGQRLLPSAAGRTTMCPTELLYDSTRPPSIRLL